MINVGIDFGTSTCCLSYVCDNEVKIIPNPITDYFTIPSLVSFSGDHCVFGSEVNHNEFPVISNIKRLIGHQGNESQLKSFFHLPLKDDDTITILYNDSEVPLNDVLSNMFRKLSYIITDYLQTDQWQCVVTVPAYFNEEQRNILWTAIRIADINCMKLLNEPSSACIGYLEGKTFSNLKVLVIDFGAGTLDLSVIDVENTGVEVLCEVCGIYGDNNLGGIDVTRILSEELNVSLTEAEELKKVNNYDTILEQHFGERVRECINRVLDVAKTTVDEIVFIGGSSKLPWLRRLVRHHLNKEPITSINNFEEKAVSMGAALHCDHVANHRSVVLIDRIPLSLGVNAMGLMNVIIPRNTTIPISKTKMYTTEEDEQASVQIDVYQGESKFLEHNTLIGSFTLDGIPKLAKGEPAIYVTIKVNVNGIVEVRAREKRGGNGQELHIKRDKMDESQILEMQNRVDREKEMKYHRLHTTLYKLYTLMERVNFQVFDNCVLDLEDEVRQKVFDELIEPVIHTVSLLKPYQEEYKLNLSKWNHILELDEESSSNVDIRFIIDKMDKWCKIILDQYAIYVIADQNNVKGFDKQEKGDDFD